MSSRFPQKKTLQVLFQPRYIISLSIPLLSHKVLICANSGCYHMFKESLQKDLELATCFILVTICTFLGYQFNSNDPHCPNTQYLHRLAEIHLCKCAIDPWVFLCISVWYRHPIGGRRGINMNSTSLSIVAYILGW